MRFTCGVGDTVACCCVNPRPRRPAKTSGPCINCLRMQWKRLMDPIRTIATLANRARLVNARKKGHVPAPGEQVWYSGPCAGISGLGESGFLQCQAVANILVNFSLKCSVKVGDI